MTIDRWLRIVSMRWRSIVGRGRADRDLDDELRDHVESEVERLLATGVDPESARRLAVRRVGELDLVREACREARGVRFVDTATADVRYTLRTLRRSPGFAAAAIATLALGIGANVAVFSLADGILLSPLPYPDPDRLVSVTATYPAGGYAALHESVRTFEAAAYAEGHAFTLRAGGEPFRVDGTLVSASLMPVLGVQPAIGRWMRPEEDVFGNDRVVILSDALWVTAFGGRADIAGRFIEVDGVRREIIGVMPAGFAFPSARTSLWIPLGIDARNTPRYWAGDYMPIVGRLRPRAARQDAATEVARFQARVRSLFPWPMPDDWNRTIAVVPLQEAIVGAVRPRLLILAAAVAAVLLIACANVASLMLSRAASREREIGIRAALGASPGRIARQMFTESLVLALAGAAAGLIAARGVLSALVRVLPADTPRLGDVRMNVPVLLFGAALGLATGCVFGFAPVTHALRLRLRAALDAGGRVGQPVIRARMRAALTVGQIACAVVLVVGAGLLVRSLWGLTRLNPGFEADGIVTATVSPPPSICGDTARCLAFYRQLEDRLRTAPGVADAALVNTLPLTGAVAKRSLEIEGYSTPAVDSTPLFWLNVVSADYIPVMRIAMMSGRRLNDADATGAPVAIVSMSAARHFWPGRSPIGTHIRFVGERQWRTVVGVASDVHAYDLTRAEPEWMAGTVYVPQSTTATLEDGRIPTAMTVTIRTALPPARVATLVRTAIGRPDVALGAVRSMPSIVAAAIATPAATARLLASMATLAVTMGAIGIYAVLSGLIAARRRDLGVRFALGASRANVFWLVTREAALMCAAGITIGMLAAAGVMRWLSTELYGVSPTDPATYSAVGLTVVFVTFAACYVPTRRAMNIDPIIVLRQP